MSTEKRRTISRKQLTKAFFNWFFFSHSCYNYERLQSISFSQAMFSVLKDLYDTKEEIGREMEKHMAFFNTEPNLGCIIHGVVCAMEEERANTGAQDSPITDDSIIAIKTGLMGPFAGIGDTLIQGIIVPLFLSIGIGMAMQENLIGPWFALVGISASLTGIAYFTWMYGYRWGSSAVDRILEGGMMDNILLAAGILGCVVMGSLVATNVQLYTPIQFELAAATATEDAKYMVLQRDFFDAILKGLLPLGITFLTLRLMRKGWSINRLMAVLAIAGFVLGALGILSNVAPEL